jgi:entericidin B
MVATRRTAELLFRGRILDPATMHHARHARSKIMVRKILMVGLIAGTFAVSACNTVAGAGKDVSSVGHATTKAADSNK